MEKLHIVRHGEIDLNVEGRYAGSTDVELNKKGLLQAHSTANEVSKFNIDLIITSPLKRCTVMAGIIHQVIKAPIIVIDDFKERGVGVYEGLTREEAKNQYPKLWAKNITRIYNDAPTGGETIAAVVKRVQNGLKLIQKKYQGKIILIVTHAFIGKVIHKLLKNINEQQFFEYKLENAKVITYDFNESPL